MSTSIQAKKIYQKYLDGDSLTNAEIDYGVEFFTDLADKLIQCGERFALAFHEARRMQTNFEGFQQARKRNA